MHYELLAEIVRKQHAGSDDAWWCNDQALVARFPATQVENLDCFTLPEAGPVLVERWEPVPADADVEPTLPTRMKGQGFRLWLDVRAPGALVLAPNGQCGQGSLAVLRIDG